MHPQTPDELEEIQRLFMELAWYERRHFARDLGELGLTMPQFVTLNVLQASGTPWPMGALAETVDQCSATMTGIVDRLVRLGLVERRRSDEDRRSVLVGLTREGEELLRRAKEHRHARMRRILAHFDPEDRKAIVHLLRKYLQVLRLEEETSPVPPPSSGSPDEGPAGAR
ncbi:MAG: MarR family transcriptional regulator [Anaerolineae bacterium]|nr:MarR family transcriptional regulator [Anaerolineae bacterium]